MGTLRNLARNSLRPSYLPVMVEKLGRRLWGSRRGEARLARAWAEERAERWGDFAREQNEALWREAESWARGAEVEARKTLADLNVALGGAGAFPLLYFLVRWRRPRVVVETGVAAGYSSLAVLSSLRANGFGKLYSSDFPYFRLKDPEQYVGCLVPDELRSGWELRLEGDRRSLPEIVGLVDKVDLFHYDSDKSRAGRRFALETVASRLGEDSVVIMDDINDNLFFRDYVEAASKRFRVFDFNRKYVGVIGL